MSEINYEKVAEIALEMGCPPEIEGCAVPDIWNVFNALQVMDALHWDGFHIGPELSKAICLDHDYFLLVCGLDGGRSGFLVERVGLRDGKPIYRYTGERQWPLPIRGNTQLTH